MNKINLGIIFGGKSTEHEISLISAKNIINAADKKNTIFILLALVKMEIF